MSAFEITKKKLKEMYIVMDAAAAVRERKLGRKLSFEESKMLVKSFRIVKKAILRDAQRMAVK